MSRPYYDISPTISESLAVFPEDKPFSRHDSLKLAQGASVNLSSIETTLHIGAHADSPHHYNADGKSSESLSLVPYFGPCQVITVEVPAGERVFPEDLPCDVKAPRVLLKTNSFPDPNAWNDDFNSFSPDLIRWLHERRVILIGIDTPSIDPWDSKKLESHQTLALCGMANLEGLVLSEVPDGTYWLVAMPLKIQGADGSPVRAILWNEDIDWKK